MRRAFAISNYKVIDGLKVVLEFVVVAATVTVSDYPRHGHVAARSPASNGAT